MKNKLTHHLPNYGKLAMLHRSVGSPYLVVYSGTISDCQKLYAVFQEWCNNSSDIELHDTDIRCKNPMLAWHLQEVVKIRKIVPISNLSPQTALTGGMII